MAYKCEIGVEMHDKILEQIELELKYAKIKHPVQENTLPFAMSLAIKKLSGTTSCNNSCYFCIKSSKDICYSIAAIAILIRSLTSEYRKDPCLFIQRINDIQRMIED